MRLLMTAGTDFEAEIVSSRLREAGIVPLRKGEGLGVRGRGLFVRDVYVEDADLERARAVLAEAQDVSEEELIRLSESGDEGEAGDT